MIFAFPYALLGTALVGGLVAVYLLRSRARRRPVGSVMLWRKVARPRQGGVRRDVLVLPPLFYLELLALVLLVLAAATPLVLRSPTQTLVVVTDVSASMAARDNDGVSARERAVRALQAEASRWGYAQVRLILAGHGEPEVAGVMALDTAAKRLASTDCVAPGDSVMRALSLAPENQAVLVLTDRPPPEQVELRPGVMWRACGLRLPNAAVAHASRSPQAGGGEALLVDVAGFDWPGTVRVRVMNGDAVLVERAVTLDAQGKGRLVVSLPQGTPAVAVVLDDDALAVDNHAVLFPETPRPLHVAVDVSDEALRKVVERALRATGRVAEGGGVPQLRITDSAPDMNATAWQLAFHKPEAPAWLRGPYLADRGGRLLEGVTLEGLVWPAGTNAPPGRAWILAGSRPLLTEEVSFFRAPVFRLVADGAQGTFFQSPAWPAFVWNLVALCGEAQPGLASPNLRAGIATVLRGASGEMVLEEPGGKVQAVPLRGGSAVWMPELPGVYALRNGDAREPFAVNFFAPTESDLRGCRHGSWGSQPQAEVLEQTHKSYAWLAALVALALLAAHHFCLFRRTKKGGSAE